MEEERLREQVLFRYAYLPNLATTVGSAGVNRIVDLMNLDMIYVRFCFRLRRGYFLLPHLRRLRKTENRSTMTSSLLFMILHNDSHVDRQDSTLVMQLTTHPSVTV